jgi:putative endonuclease
MRGHVEERTERRRGAHLCGFKTKQVAAILLRLKGCRILARRFVVSGGEIDLIAKRGAPIAFVEVKARADMEIAAIATSATKRRRTGVRRGCGSRGTPGRELYPSSRRRVRRAWAASRHMPSAYRLLID